MRTYQIVQPFRGHDDAGQRHGRRLCPHPEDRGGAGKGTAGLRITKLDHKAQVQARSLNLCEQKRLEVARALATEPKLIMLDEVMAGLNPSEVYEVMDIVTDIRKQGITVVIIEHIMQAVMNISDNITVLSFGEKIAEGTPKQIAEDPKVISVYLGAEYEQS